MYTRLRGLYALFWCLFLEIDDVFIGEVLTEEEFMFIELKEKKYTIVQSSPFILSLHQGAIVLIRRISLIEIK